MAGDVMKHVHKNSSTEAEKNHPAMLVLEPDDYAALSKTEQKEANDLARLMNESVFTKDKTAYLHQLRLRFGQACMKKILMDMRPADGWVGHVTFPEGEGKSLYRNKLDKHYPDLHK